MGELDGLNARAGPERSPSGKKTTAYGEIMIKVWIIGEGEDMGAEAVVTAPPDLPDAMLIVAAEHLLTAAAMKSGAGFERAIELIVEGAMSNKGKLLRKKPK
jgi:hypothetical protein